LFAVSYNPSSIDFCFVVSNFFFLVQDHLLKSRKRVFFSSHFSLRF
jgi:hypothetical protein